MNAQPLRTVKAAIVVVTILSFGAVVSEAAFARGHGGGGHSGGHHSGHSGAHHGHHGHGSHSGSGGFVGGSIFWGGYYYPPPYYYPGVAAPPFAPGYIQQGDDSYYCAETARYYPDVTECTGNWLLVTPPPIPPS